MPIGGLHQTNRTLRILGAALLLVCGLSLPALGQPVPLGDEVNIPLTPAGISTSDGQISADWVWLWNEADGTAVIKAVGEFRLELGSRTLRADEAVVWLSVRQHEERPYQYLEIFLWQRAAIEDPGGASMTGSALFGSVATFGKIHLAADRKALAADSESTLYQDALKVRTAWQEHNLPERSVSPLPTIDFAPPAEPPPPRSFRWANLETVTMEGETVAVVSGPVYFSQGESTAADFLEIRADNAVLFAEDLTAPATQPTGAEPRSDFAPEQLKSIYLEGDVVLTRGQQMVRAEKIYYDLQNEKALIIDPVMSFPLPARDIPLYVRAAEARQLSRTEFSAKKAKITTSEFYTPHFHIGAEQLYIFTETAPSDVEGVSGSRAGAFSIAHATYNVEGWPIAYWPWSSGNFNEGESSFKGLRANYDGDFGASVETSWDAFGFFGLQKPEGFKDATLFLDFYSERGIGVGENLEYEFDKSYGLFRGYFINDWGDEDSVGPFRDNTIYHPNRGRATWRHRQFLPDDWELTLEGSYISDENFLEEYFEQEFDEDKDQETYFKLKKQRDNWALQLVTQARLMDWLTQTDRLPEASFRLIAEPLGPLDFYSANRLGALRYQPDERRLFIEERNGINNDVKSGVVFRGDTRQEVTLPFLLGPLKLVPFTSGRAGWWDDAPYDNGHDRLMGSGGVRGSMYLQRVYEEVQSQLLDLNGLRHLIKLDMISWLAGSMRDSRDLFPFDPGVEQVDGFSGVSFGLRQRWQTKRGPADNPRVVDWLTLDLEAGFFNNPQVDEFTNGYASPTRPEESITSNYVAGQLNWRIGDTTAILSDANFNLDKGNLDIANISYAVERTPRFSYFIGWRLIGETESHLFGYGFNYRISEKHALAMRTYHDLDRGTLEQFDITWLRKFPRWYLAMTLAVDEIEDNITGSVSLWPEGFSNLAIGSKRYTGLADSTAIKTE
ncbi:MAG: LPS-assembly protein LptD [Phycisphaerae bacterium]|nr:LPS-assembly protein LptD [Phycisphaerae bacterium]